MSAENVTKLADLLEKKREQLAEGIEIFAKRIFPDLTERSAAALYRQVKNADRPFPKKRFAVVAEFLEISVSEVEALHNNNLHGRSSRDPRFTFDELRRMADITAAAGKPLKLSLLMEILDAKE